ncbi:hypothetical protein [Chromobacterium haemolyticum]|uniref:hypothetical protein n=1 Tax=Chromobacterium haemolyticum TaxID=394935 RepID=UPI00244D36F8|nr:hypothetical protein [Chromobacterium haemolyticum]MDH0342139.1 hypothetical protein [Chromobacterium haemolyticum]
MTPDCEPIHDTLLQRCRLFGKQQRIRQRWALDPVYPQPNDFEVEFLEELHAARSSNIIVESSGIKVRLGSDISPWITYLLLCDAYEHGDIRLISEHIYPGQKVIVIGGGIGVISAAIAKKAKVTPTIIEANPLLLGRLDETAILNNVDFNVIHGAVLAGHHSGVTKFYLSEDFWASSLREDTWLQTKTIDVPIIDMAKKLSEKYDVAFFDIEGEEVGLFEHLPLPQNLKTLFVEIHRPVIGAKAEASVMNRLWEQGFKLVDSDGLTGCWQRL